MLSILHYLTFANLCASKHIFCILAFCELIVPFFSFLAHLDEVQKSLCTTPESASVLALVSASTFTLKFFFKAHIFKTV